MDALLPEPVTVARVPSADRVYLGHPSVLALPGGRILAAVDYQGPDVRGLGGQMSRYADTNFWMQGRLFASADEGQTWTQKADFPFAHPCLFRDGNQVYLLGQRGGLVIMRSPDGGETWSKPTEIQAKGGFAGAWALSPCSVLRANGHLNVALLVTRADVRRRVMYNTLEPALMRAPEGMNLTVSKSWTWSEPSVTLDQWAPWDAMDGLGLPFFDSAPAAGQATPGRAPPFRPCWTYPHAAHIADPRHHWHDPLGRTVHVLFAADTQRGNLAALARCTAGDDGALRFTPQVCPSGKRQIFLPLPGGNRKFHLVADETAGVTWLLSNQVRNSMQRADGNSRPGQAAEQTHLLQLSFSSNLVDWAPAGWVAGTPTDPLTDPAMDIRGKDLAVVACARDAEDKGNRHVKRLVFGLVRDFRKQLYAMA